EGPQQPGEQGTPPPDRQSGQQSGDRGTPHTPESQRAHSSGLKRGAGAGALAGGGALIAGATGGSVVGTAESMMQIATAMATAASVPLPPALTIVFMYKQCTGKPSKLEKCAQDWADTAKELHQAAQNIRELAEAIPGEAWTMDDRPLYESQVRDFGAQLDTLGTYCTAVQTAIMVVAWALFTYAVFAMGMAVYLGTLAAVAAVAAAAAATGVGAPAAAATYAKCLALVTVGIKVTTVASGILVAVGTGAAAVLLGGAYITTNSQEGNGAHNASAAFNKALATGAAGAAANITEGLANSGLNFVTRSGLVPTGNIDLDADRGIDKTWNLGVGGKVTSAGGVLEGEGGYHAKIKDGDFQGQDVELKAKVGDPNSWGAGTVGGKLEWNEKESLENKTFMGGVESPKTGVKAEYEGNFNDKNDYSDKYNVNSPVFNRFDGSINKKPEDETPPWDKNL
ncbi:hypothetical protein AB0L25_23120, partial [Spirillospora sp. NPDC052242]